VLARNFLPRTHIPDVAHSFAGQVMLQRQNIAHFRSCNHAHNTRVNQREFLPVRLCRHVARGLLLTLTKQQKTRTKQQGVGLSSLVSMLPMVRPSQHALNCDECMLLQIGVYVIDC